MIFLLRLTILAIFHEFSAAKLKIAFCLNQLQSCNRSTDSFPISISYNLLIVLTFKKELYINNIIT
jgi:hypothetical protein